MKSLPCVSPLLYDLVPVERTYLRVLVLQFASSVMRGLFFTVKESKGALLRDGRTERLVQALVPFLTVSRTYVLD